MFVSSLAQVKLAFALDRLGFGEVLADAAHDVAVLEVADRFHAAVLEAGPAPFSIVEKLVAQKLGVALS